MLMMPRTSAAVQPPPPFLCPISLDLMSDPVVSADSGLSFDRSSIERWLSSANNPTCPLTRAPLSLHRLLPNYTLRRLIHAWSSSSDAASAAAALSARLVSSLPVSQSTNTAAATNDSAAAAAADIMQQIGSLAAASPKAQRMFAELGTVDLMASLALDPCRRLRRHAHACEAFAPANRRTERLPPPDDDEPSATATAALAILSSSFLPCLPPSILPYPSRLASLSHLLSCGRSPPASRASAATIVAYLAADSGGGRPASPPPTPDPYPIDIDRSRATIGSTPHLFSGLLSLIRRRDAGLDQQHPTPDSRLRDDTTKIAIRALFALSLCAANWAAAIQAGAPAALLEWLSEADTKWRAVPRVERARQMAVATLELLCKAEEGRRELAAHPRTVAQMKRMVAEGGGGGRAGECAAGVLLAIARTSEAVQLAMVEEGVVAPLLLLLQCHGSSSPRAKKNAISLLKLLQSNWSHHPSIAQISYTLFSLLRNPN